MSNGKKQDIELNDSGFAADFGDIVNDKIKNS
jgi:hypothetical protein